MKKVASIALVAAMTVGGVSVPGLPVVAAAASGSFLDDDGSLYEPYINAVAAAGITRGCSSSLYCPNAMVTRGEMATFLARALGLTPVESGPFVDVAASIHASNINALATAGITSGCSDSAYCPNRTITREEMASLLARSLNLTAKSAAPFTDVAGSPYASDIAAIAQAGITVGCEPSRYCPHDPTSRAQMATFLARAFKLPVIFPSLAVVHLRPGDNVAAIVAGAASGTTFRFAAGTYQGVSIVPKANMVFLGSGAAVLAGNGKRFAFRSGAANVTIRGFVIEGYFPDEKKGAISHDGGATNWVVDNNEIRYNREVGVSVNDGWKVVGNFIHHNGRYGINGSGAGILIEGNEIAYNSTDYGATAASGGNKFVHTSGLVIRGNYSHHNFGNGLWVDINNVDVSIENNRVVANERNGIFLEISCGGVVRNNYVEGNGTVPKIENWMGGSSGILVSMTPSVEVYGNTLVGNGKGIGALNWDHPNVGAVTHCTPELRDLQVYNNSITQNGGAAAGIEAPRQTENVLSNWGNRFHSNTYHLSGGAQYRLRDAWVSPKAWADAGQN